MQWDFAGVFYAVLSGAITSGGGYILWYGALRELSATHAATVQLSVPVIASGGVTDMECIVKLNEVKDAGIEGVIIGRALYERTINLPDAQAYIDQH